MCMIFSVLGCFYQCRFFRSRLAAVSALIQEDNILDSVGLCCFGEISDDDENMKILK